MRTPSLVSGAPASAEPRKGKQNSPLLEPVYGVKKRQQSQQRRSGSGVNYRESIEANASEMVAAANQQRPQKNEIEEESWGQGTRGLPSAGKFAEGLACRNAREESEGKMLLAIINQHSITREQSVWWRRFSTTRGEQYHWEAGQSKWCGWLG
jgi:hypothetical protein